MDTLHSIVKQKHLLKHPFYRLWLKGKLPKEALQNYAGQYFQLVSNLPRFISSLHANCEDETTRQQLVHHLMEEELGFGNGNVAHTELWLDFAEELNVKRSEAKNPLILKATKNAVATIWNNCQKSLAEGAAALYAYESQVPEISEEKIRGLREFYGLETVKALRFFTVHAEADKKHRAVWDALSKKLATTLELQRKVKTAAQETSEALWKMFDAMYEEFVPEKVKIKC